MLIKVNDKENMLNKYHQYLDAAQALQCLFERFPISKGWKWSDNSPVDPQCVSNHRGFGQSAFMQTVECDKIVSSLYKMFLNWSLNLANKFKNLRKNDGLLIQRECRFRRHLILLAMLRSSSKNKADSKDFAYI